MKFRGPLICLLLVIGLVLSVSTALADDTLYTQQTIHGFEFVSLPAGQFVMGTNEFAQESLKELGWWTRFLETEQPAHLVVIQKPFLLGVTEVTQAQWRQTMGSLPKQLGFRGDDRPIESVSWGDVQTFLAKLNTGSDYRFRLPTEAEWEYACRAGSWGLFSIGRSGTPIVKDGVGAYGWSHGNADGSTHQVAQKQPNAWGLFDMFGNVWEMCSDYYDRDAYRKRKRPVLDPRNNDPFPERVMRGGSWYLPERYMRSAMRSGISEDLRSPYVGFRLVCEHLVR
jgi:formylglycine-generating enzyme required for sulfatase activity